MENEKCRNKDIYGGGPGPRNVVLTVNKEENKSLAIFVGSILDFVLVDPTIRVQTYQKESLGIKIGKKTFPPFKIVPD